MKKSLLLSLLFIVVACQKQHQEETIPNDCCSPPPYFGLYINKNSDVHKTFLNTEGAFDAENISLYRLDNDIKTTYRITHGYIDWGKSDPKSKYLVIGTQLDHGNDVYTGKTETLYLKNALKTYKVEVEGAMISNNGCCPVAKLKEIRIDGVKIEDYFLAK